MRSYGLILSFFALTGTSAFAASVSATYLFQDSLAATQSGVSALTVVDPLSQNSFQTDTVFGQSRRVYEFVGTSTNTQQSGLVFDNSAGVIPGSSYSVELVFQFFDRNNNWRRIVDVQNRQSDAGLYVDPSNKLSIYPVGNGPTNWTNNAYHHVVLTNSGTEAIGYLDGVYQFTLTSNLMNINNPQNVVNLFLDNVAAGGQGEYSSGRIAAAQFYSGVLSSQEIAAIYATDPLPEPPPVQSAVPEPVSMVLAGAGLVGIVALRRRRTA